ncbi:MAG: hypothetical protein ACREX9_14315, partial [Gammaproteobacteria bacterium]
ILRRLAALRPKTLAVMHGSSYVGDGAGDRGAHPDAQGRRWWGIVIGTALLDFVAGGKTR